MLEEHSVELDINICGQKSAECVSYVIVDGEMKIITTIYPEMIKIKNKIYSVLVEMRGKIESAISLIQVSNMT